MLSATESMTLMAPETRLHILFVTSRADKSPLAGWLRQDGHQVDVVTNGAAALEAEDLYRHDVVFLNMSRSGGFDGWETARRLAQRERLKKPLLVAITDWDEENVFWQAPDSIVDLHLTKPMDHEVLGLFLDKFHRIIRDV